MALGQDKAIARLNREIIKCTLCPRLVDFREKISKEKRRQYASEEYWGKPVPGYGDAGARLVVVGLAPAAHGGNRTGRVFTGDSSARFLVKHLHAAGFANQPTSTSRNDGLVYKDAYITAVVRCVPPGDKPTAEEKHNCFPYFQKEISLLKNASAILALGRFAFDSIVSLAKEKYGARSRFEFKHGGKYLLSENFPTVYTSYHPSPRNTNTGKLTDEMFTNLLQRIKSSMKPYQ
ncbi:MAG: uracil-DNA glycosylase [Nitrososphaerales archaeon]